MFDALYEDGGVRVLCGSTSSPADGRTTIIGRHGDALKVRVAATVGHGRANEALA